MNYTAYTLNNFRDIPQIKKLTEEQIRAIEVVGAVLPFKTNNYVVDNLIDWSNIPYDPMFIQTFPQKDMLLPEHYRKMEAALDATADKVEIKKTANEIRMQLNPHPAGQIEYNVPSLHDNILHGMQHKYRETVLFFPSKGQSCHAYCTFCFRWVQFVGMNELKFASNDADVLVRYVSEHPEVSDVLFTGGDPLLMKTSILATYVKPLLDANLPHVRNIRIGTKALAYWPYRFLTDSDAGDLLNLFREVKAAGRHLAFMAHFNHPAELEGETVRNAISRVLETGAVIRTQSPLLRHINDSPEVWAELWRRQVALGCIPYYMFVARDTGAQHYFGVPLVEAWQIFRNAYQSVSGICRTVRGPSMSCVPGKVQILGVSEVRGQKVMVFRMIQGRNPDWAARPFHAAYDETATWYDDLKPAFGEDKFFFQDELDDMLKGGERKAVADVVP
jgi:KamA family protein